MPVSLRDIALDYGPDVVDFIQKRSAAGNATKTLVNGTNQATQTLVDARGKAIDVYGDIYGKQRADQQPFYDAGTLKLKELVDRTSAGGDLSKPFDQKLSDYWDPSKVTLDPSFAVIRDQAIEALDRSASAKGTLNFGGYANTVLKKATELASTNYGAAYDRAYRAALDQYDRAFQAFTTNQNTEYGQLRDMVGIGQTAAGQLNTAGSTYAAQVGQTIRLTADDIAKLQTEAANAQAAGDIAKSNAITGLIESGVKTYREIETLKGLTGGGTQLSPATQQAINAATTSAATATPNISTLSSASLGAPGGALAPTAPAIGDVAPVASAAPEIASAAPELTSLGSTAAESALGAGGLSLAGLGATDISTLSSAALGLPGGALAPVAPAIGDVAPVGTTAAGGGLSSTITGFLTNPITIGVGAALAGLYALHKYFNTNAQKAEFVKDYQDPFGSRLKSAVGAFQTALASGQLSEGEAQQMRAAIVDNINQFEAERRKYASKGKKESKVAANAQRTMTTNFGTNFSKLLGDIDNDFARNGWAVPADNTAPAVENAFAAGGGLSLRDLVNQGNMEL